MTANYPQSQERVGEIAQKVDEIVHDPFLISTLERTTENLDGLGWGVVLYRAGEQILSQNRQHKDQLPTELTFYPKIPILGIEGTLHWYGPDSYRNRREGKLFNICLEPETELGGLTKQYQVQRSRGGQLIIGKKASAIKSARLHPLDDQEVDAFEGRLDILSRYVELIADENSDALSTLRLA